MSIRSWSAVLVSALALSIAGAPQVAAETGPPPPEQRYHVANINAIENVYENTVNGFSALPLDSSGEELANGVHIRLDLYSCGRFLVSQEATASPQGGKGFHIWFADSVVKRVGRSIQYRVTYTHPGFDPYTESSTYADYTVKRPSCQEINHPLRVKWSKVKLGRPMVGKRVSLTATTAPGARVSYEWKLENNRGNLVGATLAKGRTVLVKQAWVGRRLGVIVRVQKSGYQQQVRRIVLARVKPRS